MNNVCAFKKWMANSWIKRRWMGEWIVGWIMDDGLLDNEWMYDRYAVVLIMD